MTRLTPSTLAESAHRDEPLVPAAVGGDLRVSLSCPTCGAEGWVAWRDLRHGLRCPKCNGAFLFARGGRLQSLARVPQVRFTCPRCRQAGSLPEMLTVRGAECTACHLPLVRGPDQQLHEAKEAQRLHQAAIDQSRRQAAERRGARQPRFIPSLSRPARLAGVVALAAALLLTSLIAAGNLFGRTPEGRVGQFMRCCLAGDWSGALAMTPDDDVARTEFARWRVRHFSSILDRFRPAGDQVAVTVETVRETAAARVLRVTLASPFIGRRTHEETWRHEGNLWLFDPAATLQAEDRPPRDAR